MDALKKMGLPVANIDNLYYHTHGELLALIRRIPGNSNMIKPKWCDNAHNHLLYPLLFLRVINVNDTTTQKICEALVDISFEDLLSAYNDYL